METQPDNAINIASINRICFMPLRLTIKSCQGKMARMLKIHHYRYKIINHGDPPSLPGDLIYLDTDYTVVPTSNSLNFPESGWWVEFPCNEITGPNFDRFRGVGV